MSTTFEISPTQESTETQESERRAMYTNIGGFATFGLAARFGQLAIQKRPFTSNPAAHLGIMAGFGILGYWAHQWDKRAEYLIKLKRTQIAERRAKRIEQGETLLRS